MQDSDYPQEGAVRVTLTDAEREHVVWALTETLRQDCQAAADDLSEHSPLALEDARGAVGRAAEVSAVLERLK